MKTMNPKTLNVSIKDPNLISAIVETARQEGEADYNYWLRCYLDKNLNSNKGRLKRHKINKLKGGDKR